MDSDQELLDSEKASLSDSSVKHNINLLDGGLFNTYTDSSSNTSSAYTSLSQSASLSAQAYGSTSLTANGKSSNVVLSEFDPFPVDMICPECQQPIVTTVKYKVGKATLLASLLIALLTCGLGCCFVPFCMSHLKDVYHSCPDCGTTIGVYRRKWHS